MADSDIKTLLSQRSAIKGRITRFKTYLETISKVADLSSTLLTEHELRLSQFEILMNKFDQVQNQLEILCPSDTLDIECDNREIIQSEFFRCIAEAKGITAKHSQQSGTALNENGDFNVSASNYNPGKNVGFKLPQIQISKFDGSLQQWLEFRDIFVSLIHDNESIQPVHKFHYLNSYLHGDAARVLCNLEVSNMNYPKAWSLLCERYDNKRQLINNHLNSLLSINQLTRESDKALRSMIDHVGTNLRALSTLGQPTDQWDTIVVHIMSSKLDSNTSLKWEEYRNTFDDMPTLEQFKRFLKDRADVLETFHQNKVGKPKPVTHNNNSISKPMAYTTQVDVNKGVNSVGFSNTNMFKTICVLCKDSHRIYDCPKFLALSPEQRIVEAAKLKLCLNCLRPGHNNYTCRAGPCRKCNRRHNSLLHKVVSGSQAVEFNTNATTSSITNMVSNLCVQPSNQVLLSTATVEVVNPVTQNSIRVRVLLDSGSQSTLMSKSLKDRLGLQSVTIDNVNVIGIGNKSSSFINELGTIQIKSLNSNFNVIMSCPILPELTGNIPKTFIDFNLFNLPANLKLADHDFNKPGSIDLLIGADLFWDIIKKQRRTLGINKPYLLDSQLGWIVSGPIVFNCESKQNIQCNFVASSETLADNSLTQQVSRFWELEELPHKSMFSTSEKRCEDYFIKTTTRLDDGRFCVRLPLKSSAECLGDSFNLAKKRFLYLEKRFRQNSELKRSYCDFINEYKTMGHCSELLSSISKPEQIYYLCHHAVFKINSESTKLRVVFDGSAPSSSGISINDLQLIGPNIQDSIFSILLRFRQYNYVLTGDVEKMYRQINLHEEDRRLQRILWREDESLPIQTLQLNTVTYGFASASYLSTRCLWQLGEECSDDFIKNIIQHDFLVDDLLTGSDSEAQLLYILESVTIALSLGCFPLRKFRSNHPTIFKNPNINLDGNLSLSDSTSALGLGWNPSTDNLFFSLQFPKHSDDLISKRIILSQSLKLFDPLGLLSPCTIQPKMLLQKLWKEKLDWDEPVPINIKREWLKLTHNFKLLADISIPRHVLSSKPTVSVELHSFCDASMSAYGACIYLRAITNNGQVTVRLLTGKSKVAPIKPTTIPRLELCGALLAARLCKAVTNSLRLTIHKLVHWCDSTVVLSWLLSSPSNLKVFAANRVAEICELTDSSSWRHVPTNMNPADLISRGVDANQIQDMNIWWSGPAFLLEEETQWPMLRSLPEQELPELKVHLADIVEDSIIQFSKFSNYNRLVRCFAYVLRFISNLKGDYPKLKDNLTAGELETSHNKLLMLSQKASFSKEHNLLLSNKPLSPRSHILSLQPFLDDQGILRVGGRLNLSSYNFDKKHPALIDSKHQFCKLLFIFKHKELMHAGPQLLLYSIRESLWPLNGRALARRTVRQCFRCTRLQGRTLAPMMGNLPSQRITAAFPFQTVGVDFGGPFSILNRKGRGATISKCYLCLFICLRYKCVHLEAVSELSKDAFISSIRRFISRRGKPVEIFCDNGRNFVAAAKDIGSFLQTNLDSLSDFATSERINFKFIPAYAPHFGGIWEAGIKSAKHHIKRVMGNNNLTFEELTTLFAQVEAILNSRPLSPMSSSPQDLLSLSPGHFLIGRPLTSLPSASLDGVKTTSLNRYARLEQIRQGFWKRWQKEYVSELQQRSKWRVNSATLKIGDLVLIYEENASPLNWRLGRVTKLFPGSDGISRVADIHTTRGIVRRPFTKLCALPTIS